MMLLLLLLAGGCSWLGTAALRRYALSGGLLDEPNARRRSLRPSSREMTSLISAVSKQKPERCRNDISMPSSVRIASSETCRE